MLTSTSFIFLYMSKKMNKSILKRFKITKNKKVLFRPAHQDHFNAKEGGNQTRKKRKVKTLTGTLAKEIVKLRNR